MPSELGQEFNDVSRYPYMAVASPSCHDTTTTRSWWEEAAGRRERFFAEELHMQVPSHYLYLRVLRGSSPVILRECASDDLEKQAGIACAPGYSPSSYAHWNVVMQLTNGNMHRNCEVA